MIHIKGISKSDLIKAKPIILAITSVIFNTVAIGTAIKATVETTRIVDEKKAQGEIDKKELFKTVAPKYILPVAAFTIGQVSTIGSALLSRQQSLALSGALAATDLRYRKYREKNRELYGTENDDRIMIEISKDCTPKYVDYSNCVGNSIDNVDGEYTFNDNPTYYAPEGKLLFFDEYRYGLPMKNGHTDDGYFVCTVNQFQQARLHLNRNFMLRGDAALNEFYRFLGISETPNGEELYWDMSTGIQFIDIGLRPFQIDEGLTAYRIDYDFPPESWYDISGDDADEDPPWHS